MHDIRSILVALDPLTDEQPALQRARLIAENTGSQLFLLDSGENPPDYLEALAEELRADGHYVSTRQLDRSLGYRQIMQIQQEQDCGLVIKQHYRNNPLTRLLLTPDDWNLLRHCPCPVLLVRGLQAWDGQPVLAAVDVTSSTPEQEALQSSIIQSAIQLCRMIHGPLNVITTRPSTPLSVNDPSYSMGQAMTEQHQKACSYFSLIHGICAEQLHICEGNPAELIPRLAARLDACITVIGSAGRAGLNAALMGNTAETVLEAVDHDVLVIKP